MMEIEKLVERLKKAQSDGSWNTLADLAHKAATALEQLRDESEKLKAQVPRWIPVEERLPEQENTQVLMMDGECHYISSRNNMVRFLDCEGIFIPGKAGAGVKVTHWMPLPPGPSAKGEE